MSSFVAGAAARQNEIGTAPKTGRDTAFEFAHDTQNYNAHGAARYCKGAPQAP